MPRRIWTYLFGSAFRRGATVLTVLTLLSYVLGLVRDVLFARLLGAGRLLDTYNAAFIIPDVLLNIFVAGALTAAFVPVFTHLLAKDAEADARRLSATMLTGAPAAMFIIGVLALIFMPFIAGIVAPGFAAEDMELLIRLSRLMLISPILFALSNTLGSILVSLERFAGYGLSPVLYNLGIIGGVFLVPMFGPTGLVIGTISGAFLHLCSRLIALWRSDFRPKGPISFKNPHFRRVLKLMVPRMAGQPIEQLTFFLFTSLASSLAIGSIAILNFARNFQSVPVALFGISFSTAIFASLSRKAAVGDRKGFLRHLGETAKPLAVVSVLSALFYIFFGGIVIDIFLGGGQFAADDVSKTASLLAFFAISIPAESMIHLLVRAFYALKDTWTPVLISVPGLILIWFIAKMLLPIYGLNALATAYIIVATGKALLLYALLRQRLKKGVVGV